MDNHRSGIPKPSGLPRASSRLPMPRAASASSQPATQRPSRTTTVNSQAELLPPKRTSTSVTRNPSLRAVPSRDRLSAAPTARRIPSSTSDVSAERGHRSLMGPPSTTRSSSAYNKTAVPSKSVTRSASQNFSVTRGLATHATSTSKPAPLVLDDFTNSSAVFRNTPTYDDESSPVETSLPAYSAGRSSPDDFDSIATTPKRTPRPTLAERTMETLSQLPSSPAVRRTASNFFEAENSGRTPSKEARSRSRTGSISSRPGSSYRNDGPSSLYGHPASRPGSSSGQPDNVITSFKALTTSVKQPLPTVKGTPNKRTSVAGALEPPRTPGSAQAATRHGQFGLRKMPSQGTLPTAVESHLTGPSPGADYTTSKLGSKTVSGRPLKPRASMTGLFKKPALPSGKGRAAADQDAQGVSTRSSLASTDDRNMSSVSPSSTAPTVDSTDDVPVPTFKKASSALRDQIAKAKQAKREAERQVSSTSQPSLQSPLVPTDTTFDFGLNDDPFGLNKLEDAGGKVILSRINTARTTGRLNISAMSLKQIPSEILQMYDLETVNGNGGSWAESVDLTRFVAADNELETLEDTLFPDVDPSDGAENDDYQGHQFGGLEALDLHGNMLVSLPLGLRRLQVLTTLNLSQNKLTNSCLEVISQIKPLRDLKLGNNLLFGQLEESLAELENLESLDLHDNSISALPKNMARLSRLRILNVNDNDFTQLHFEGLSNLPLTELSARKNKLTGTLIESGVESMQHLQILDVSMNKLTELTASTTFELPALHQLSISMNRIQSLPDIGSWKSLLTIHADENSIAEFPKGFLLLENLRHVDFTGNDIRMVPLEICRMGSLGMLRISGNPLRDKKFTSFTTEELKAALAARMEPEEEESPEDIGYMGNAVVMGTASTSRTSEPDFFAYMPSAPKSKVQDRVESDSEDFATPPTSAHNSPARQRSNTASAITWPIKPGGILDRSATQSSSLHPVVCSKLAAQHTIREIWLHNNTFTSIPSSLSFFADTLTSLSIAHNELVGESYIGVDILDLTALTELNLSHNRMTSLLPLTTRLRAPKLAKMDVSCNRITTLPVLRDFFPSLTILLVNDNHLEDLDDSWIKGLKIVDARSNDIAHLNPRLGLLGVSGGGSLERLEVTGNRFRVPRWNVLDLGTEATLRWLRGRVPVAEMAEWKSKAGEADEDIED
ncbi:leucine-rich repeat protein SHOC2 [Microdochium nivale]|nr:leucine-rich repeat protein SHOC2 [Microdochium nivale]